MNIRKIKEIPEIYNPEKAMVIKDGLLYLFNGKPIKSRASRRQELKTYYVFNEDHISSNK